MRAVGVMTVGCLGSAAVVGGWMAPHARGEILLGMLMPWLVATASLVLADRVYRRDPPQLTPFMVKAFAAKMIMFGLYVVIVVAGLNMAPRPFIISFAAYFIVLHLVEALCLRRMFESTAA